MKTKKALLGLTAFLLLFTTVVSQNADEVNVYKGEVFDLKSDKPLVFAT